MGVKYLWSILESACQQGSIENLAGKTAAVDLSIWIIESRSVSSNQHRNSLHLRFDQWIEQLFCTIISI